MSFNIRGWIISHPDRMEKNYKWLRDPNISVQEAIIPPKFLSGDYTTGRSSGEMGCWIAHYMAICKGIEQDNDFTLIIEDDVEYRYNWNKDLQSLLKIPSTPPDIFNLLECRHAAAALSRKIISEKPYIDEIIGTGPGPFHGNGGCVAALYSNRGLKWLKSCYDDGARLFDLVHPKAEHRKMLVSDGTINMASFPEFQRLKMRWMSTGNWYEARFPELDYAKSTSGFKITDDTVFFKMRRGKSMIGVRDWGHPVPTPKFDK